MTDIVKRLRGSVSQENDIFWGQWPGEEVKSYDVVRFDGSYEIERLRAENERLRAALEQIIKFADEWEPETQDDYTGLGRMDAAQIARAALEGKL